MRDYTGILVSDIADPRVRYKLGVIDYYLRDLTKGVGRIQQGLVPNGSGTSIINSGPLSDIYLVLLGRPTNQVGHGGTSPGGTLTLSSTTHTTRGFVYLGEAKQSGYDETNERIGIKTPVPLARLHITVPDPNPQTAVPTSGGAGLGWANVGGASYTISLSDSDDTTYAHCDPSVGNTTLQGNLTVVTNPGVTTGFTIKMTMRSTTIAVGETMHCDFRNANNSLFKALVVGFNGNTFTPVDTNVTTSFVQYTFTLSGADVALMNFSSQPFTYNIAQSGTPTGTFDISRIELDVPAVGGGSAEPVQKWNSASNSNSLDFAADGNGNQSLVFTGNRMAVSASAFAISETTPTSGAVLASQDAIGTVQWASASSLATKIVHCWEANGPYRIDGDVDGPYIATRAGTLSRVLLYRRLGGTSGNTGVDLLKNGTSILSAVPSIASSAAASSTALAGIGTAAFVQGDRFTVSASAVDAGSPRDWAMFMEVY